MRFLPLLALALAATAAGADTYRWIDPASGRTIISDTPPPAKAKGIVKARETDLPADGRPYAVKRAAEAFPVSLYTSPDCGDLCKQARGLLSGRGVPFAEKMLQKPEDGEELKKLVGDTVVPVLLVGKQTVRGFQAESYNNLLDLADYPAGTPLGSKVSGGAAK